MVRAWRFASGSLELCRMSHACQRRCPQLKAFAGPKPTLNALALNSFLPHGRGAEPGLTCWNWACPLHASQRGRTSRGTRHGQEEGNRGSAQEGEWRRRRRARPAGAKPTPSTPGAARAASQAQLAVLGQYIKDLSFESPGAPQSLQGPPANPQLKVSVNVNAEPRAEETFEVVAASRGSRRAATGGVIYNVELLYGGLFRLRNIPQNLLQPVLFIDCPTLLFPFMRRVLADVTRDGGFPPLMLDPIDFGRLYRENMARGEGQASN